MKQLLSSFSALLLGVLLHTQVVGQSRTITGKVVDESGAGLPGATIVVKGTSNGTVTDINGEFKLDVSGSGQYIVASFIGFKAQEIEVNSQTTFDITLQVDFQNLSEVVVVGYGTQQRKQVTHHILPKEYQNRLQILGQIQRKKPRWKRPMSSAKNRDLQHLCMKAETRRKMKLRSNEDHNFFMKYNVTMHVLWLSVTLWSYGVKFAQAHSLSAACRVLLHRDKSLGTLAHRPAPRMSYPGRLSQALRRAHQQNRKSCRTMGLRGFVRLEDRHESAHLAQL